MTAFCFLQTADIHLATLLTGLANIKRRLAEHIRAVLCTIFEALVAHSTWAREDTIKPREVKRP